MTAQRDKRTLLGLIRPLRDGGLSYREIGKRVGLSKSRVAQLIKLDCPQSPLDSRPLAQ